jgi:hypothetical protein
MRRKRLGAGAWGPETETGNWGTGEFNAYSTAAAKRYAISD